MMMIKQAGGYASNTYTVKSIHKNQPQQPFYSFWEMVIRSTASYGENDKSSTTQHINIIKHSFYLMMKRDVVDFFRILPI